MLCKKLSKRKVDVFCERFEQLTSSKNYLSKIYKLNAGASKESVKSSEIFKQFCNDIKRRVADIGEFSGNYTAATEIDRHDWNYEDAYIYLFEFDIEVLKCKPFRIL
mgnify:CR=1 FL=1